MVRDTPKPFSGVLRKVPPRVLFVRSSPRMGGLERALLALSAGLQDRGWDVSLALISRPVHHPLTAFARRGDVSTYVLPDPAPWSLQPLRYLRAVIRAVRPHVIYSWDYRSNILAFLVQRLWSEPTFFIASTHGYTDANWRQRLYKALDVAVLKNAQAVVVPSSVMEQYLTARGVSSSAIHVIPPAVDWTLVDQWARIRPAGMSLPARGTSRLVVVGRLSVEKGIDRVIDALPYMVDTYPRLSLWIVGDGPERSRLERRVAQQVLESYVHFWGWRVNPFPFIRIASCVVIPSRRESFGMVALETQGLGRPLMAAPVGALPSIVHPPNVFLPDVDVPSRWAERMVAYIRSGYGDSKERTHVQQQIRSTFSLRRSVWAHDRLFLHILEGERR